MMTTARRDPAQLSPSALPFDDAARLLTLVGGEPITPTMLEKDRASGAPVNPDGTLHLVHYCAWLVKETPWEASRAD